MSDSNQRPSSVAEKNAKRNLPSWMSSREDEDKSHGKKPADVGVNEENNVQKTPRQPKECDKPCSGSTLSMKVDCSKKPSPSNLGATSFSKLLEGVVFVLSGFVNPERSVLRSQALEMGAEYQPDWNSSCTLLVCAFPNTPKFRQVEADCGTIVSKEWISECYSQKKLIGIESYLMHAGKPWRRQNISHEASQALESSASSKPQMQTDRGPRAKSTTSVSAKRGASNPAKDCFSPSKVKKWAIDDFNKSISWLESLEDKPDASEIKKIAVEGILACLQDALDLLNQKQDIQQMTKEWNFIPRAVQELAKLEGAANSSPLLSKEELCKEAMNCKQIYEAELGRLDDDSMAMRKRPRTDESRNGDSGRPEAVIGDAGTYDSDETVEMTEEEIDLAYNTVTSKLGK